MLKYHQFIWNSFSSKPSGLYVLGRGLDCFEIEKQLIIEYSKNHELVFVFGVSDNDKQRIIWEAANSGIEFLPKDIEKATDKKERTQHYDSHLVYFHSAGVLAKDFLQGVISPDKISGFIIHHAETIQKEAGLQLCLAFYRAKNQNGFIKAFSEKIHEFTDLKQVTDLLWVRHILLFPRFETNVKQSIPNSNIQIIDIHLNGKSKPKNGDETKEFEPIISQNLVKVFELLKSLHFSFMNEYGESVNLTAEQSLTFNRKYLERVITGQEKDAFNPAKVNPLSKKVNPKKAPLIHQGLNDQQLQKILESILFFRHAFFILLHEEPMIFHEYLQTIQSRNSGQYHPLWFEFPQATSLFNVASSYAEESIPNPKLQWIANLISETPENKKILILAEGPGTVSMICNFLVGFTPRTSTGGIHIPMDSVEISEQSTGNTELSGDVSTDNIKLDDELLIDPEIFGVMQPPLIMLQELHSQADVIEKFQPDIVIFWDVTLFSLRKFEVFQARYHKEVVAYLLSFPEAKETRSMEISNEHENNIFIEFIKSLSNINLRPLESFNLGTRPIIVDDREFRSSLPLGLLKAGFKVVPQHLIVGDYVLSDDYVIERKAYSDLVGSLNSGRLLAQLQRMKQFYSKPFLLIEFTDVNEQLNAISAKGKNPAIMNKLMTILFNFPDIKLIWAKNNTEAGRTLWALSNGTQQPSAAKAIEMGSKVRDVGQEDSRQIKFLSAISFLTSQQITAIVEKCKSLRELATMSRNDMMALIEPATGLKLYAFLHSKIKQI